jgi:predicted metal-binding protein
MITVEEQLPTYIFVCCGERSSDDYPSCGIQGRELLFTLQEQLDREGLLEQFTPVPTGCLGLCCEGAGVVVHASEGIGWAGVTTAGVPAIIEKLKASIPPVGCDNDHA